MFPQYSLEGRRLWIVGLSPMGLARVVRTKYWVAAAMSLVVTLSLITLSCYLLKMSWERVVFFAAVVTVMTFALNGLAVGLACCIRISKTRIQAELSVALVEPFA